MEEAVSLEMDNHILDKEEGCYDNTEAAFSDDEEEVNNKGENKQLKVQKSEGECSHALQKVPIVLPTLVPLCTLILEGWNVNQLLSHVELPSPKHRLLPSMTTSSRHLRHPPDN